MVQDIQTPKCSREPPRAPVLGPETRSAVSAGLQRDASPAADLDEHGPAGLSYQQAAVLFCAASCGVTLHRLRARAVPGQAVLAAAGSGGADRPVSLCLVSSVAPQRNRRGLTWPFW